MIISMGLTRNFSENTTPVWNALALESEIPPDTKKNADHKFEVTPAGT